MDDHAPKPLAGVLVVDLSRHLPGPLLTRLLRDLGARVLKVEEPVEGDPVRQAPPFVDGRSTLAELLLGGVESIALDLKSSGGSEVLGRLVARADVLVESFRPGTLARFGLAPAELRRRFPRLVVCSVSGWGQDGPWASRVGHDLTYQATGGSLAASAAMPAVQVADLVGAWSGALAVVSALLARERGGEGCWIDQALLDAAVHANLTGWAMEGGGPRGLGEALPLTGAYPCYELYRTRDGRQLAVACLEPRFWEGFCRLVHRPRLVARQFDPEARREVADIVAARDLEEWREALSGVDLPVAPVLSAAEAAAGEQVAARGLLGRGDDGAFRLGYPARFDGRRPRAPAGVPPLGADTGRLVAEVAPGLAAERPGRLRRRGIGPRRGLRSVLRGWLARRLLR